MKYYLTHGYAPQYLEPRKRKYVRLKYAQYQLVNGILLRKNYDDMLVSCLENFDADKVLSKLHDGPTGGHFGGDTTAHEVLKVGYYWPTLFNDSHVYYRKCQECQKSAGKERKLVFSPSTDHY